MRAVILTMLITAILSGCVSSKPSQPGWIAGASGKFPSTDYLLGRGQANSLEDAKDRARADIAKVFQVALTVASDDAQSFKTHSANGSSADDSAASDHSANRRTGIFEGSYFRRITAHT
ncbi:MAG: LPP20 family lipoprotein, partial [Candidatus Nitrotoga sp.]